MTFNETAPAAPAPAPAPTVFDVLKANGLVASVREGYQVRDAQLQFAEAIEEAIGFPGHVVGELGTGTGKSYGYLIPAILSGRRTIVAPNVKSLQEQLVGKDLPFLASLLAPALGRPVRYAYVKGRSNYVCRERVEALRALPAFDTAEGAADWARFLVWYDATETGDVEELNPPIHFSLRAQVDAEDCRHPGCFVAAVKAKAKDADVVVANHSLVILDGIVRGASDDHAKVLPDADVLVLDEAHNVVEVASNTIGVEVSLGGWARIVAKLERLGGKTWGVAAAPATDALVAWGADLERRVKLGVERQLVLGDESALARPVVEGARELERKARTATPAELDSDGRDQWASACDAVGSFAQRCERVSAVAADEDPDAWVRYAEVVAPAVKGRPARVTLTARPVDVAPYLTEGIWNRFPTVVACSATLTSPAEAGQSPFHFFRREAGVPADAPVIELVAASPFPYKTNSLLYVPSTITADKRRDPQHYFAQVARELERVVRASGGRAFLLFTSKVALAEAHRRLGPALPAHFRVFVQGEQSRTAIVEAFRDEALVDARPAVLFATKSFFEGVDIAGRALELVVLDSLPFPVPSEPTYAAKCRRIGRETGDLQWGHFRTLTIPLVATVLKQAFGRLIRTDTDRGVVVILDERIVKNGYGRSLRRALPPAPLTQDFAEVERVFRSIAR